MLRLGLEGMGRVGVVGVVARRYGQCDHYKLLVSSNSNGVTTIRMDSSFPVVLELEEQISFTAASTVSRVESGL